MKYILSWGGGVNSTGILAMIKLGMLPQFTKENSIFVFADTCAEMPHFYAHTNICMSGMIKEGWKVKRVHPVDTPEFYSKRNQGKGLIDYCMFHTVMPSRVNRWCTMEYKSNPIKNYRKSLDCDTTLILGIGADEPHRAKIKDGSVLYPLLENGINREKCMELSKQAGLPEPKKTGCYCCPYQRKQGWLDLYHYLREYFDIAQEIEDNARTKFKGKGYYFVRDLRLTEQIKKWMKPIKEDCKQNEFMEMSLDRHCFCE